MLTCDLYRTIVSSHFGRAPAWTLRWTVRGPDRAPTNGAASFRTICIFDLYLLYCALYYLLDEFTGLFVGIPIVVDLSFVRLHNVALLRTCDVLQLVLVIFNTFRGPNDLMLTGCIFDLNKSSGWRTLTLIEVISSLSTVELVLESFKKSMC